ncbi:MAG: family 43 glycosylhydrolase [Clostridia bacterium]|nr:family 43 glycosylhydrolase [Clostridia bacterium]
MNPLKMQDIHIRDPFVLVHEGKYYMYGTRGHTCWGEATGFDVYVSDDLKNWSEPQACFENDGSFWADRHYWAPEVHQWNDAFYMFASFKHPDVCRGTAILRAENPKGPFLPHSDGPVTPREWECLDGTFYVSKAGKPYMVFCHEWLQAVDGEVCAVELTEDLRAAANKPFLLFRASEAEWGKPVQHSTGMSGWVTDGPFLWRTTDGTLLCLWASFSESGYTQAVAVSDNGDIDGKFHQSAPLFMKDGGHGMIFRSLDDQLYLTLHTPNTTPQERPHLYPVTEQGTRLVLLKR